MLSDFFQPEEIGHLQDIAAQDPLVLKLLQLVDETVEPGAYLRLQVGKLAIKVATDVQGFLEGNVTDAATNMLTSKKQDVTFERSMKLITELDKMLGALERRPVNAKNKKSLPEKDHSNDVEADDKPVVRGNT